MIDIRVVVTVKCDGGCGDERMFASRANQIQSHETYSLSVSNALRKEGWNVSQPEPGRVEWYCPQCPPRLKESE